MIGKLQKLDYLHFYFISFTTSISLQPDHCSSPVRVGACPDGQRDPLGANSIQRGPTVNLADSVARTFFVDVGRSSNVAYRLRFPVLRGDTAVCTHIFTVHHVCLLTILSFVYYNYICRICATSQVPASETSSWNII